MLVVGQWASAAFFGLFTRCNGPPSLPYRHLVQDKMNRLDFLHKVAGFCLDFSFIVLQFRYPHSRHPPARMPTFLWLNSLPSTLDLREHSDYSVCRGPRKFNSEPKNLLQHVHFVLHYLHR